MINIKFAVEIDLTLQTTLTIPSLGITDGIAKYITGNVDVDDFKQGFILDKSLGALSTTANFNNGGSYVTFSSFSFKVSNSNDYWKTVISNDLNFANKPVKVYIVVDGVFKSEWFGIIEDDPRDVTTYTFECVSTFRKLHNQICTKTVTAMSDSADDEESKEVTVPVSIGVIPFAATVPLFSEKNYTKLFNHVKFGGYVQGEELIPARARLAGVSDSHLAYKYTPSTAKDATLDIGSDIILEEGALAGKWITCVRGPNQGLSALIETSAATVYNDRSSTSTGTDYVSIKYWVRLTLYLPLPTDTVIKGYTTWDAYTTEVNKKYDNDYFVIYDQQVTHILSDNAILYPTESPTVYEKYANNNKLVPLGSSINKWNNISTDGSPYPGFNIPSASQSESGTLKTYTSIPYGVIWSSTSTNPPVGYSYNQLIGQKATVTEKILTDPSDKTFLQFWRDQRSPEYADNHFKFKLYLKDPTSLKVPPKKLFIGLRWMVSMGSEINIGSHQVQYKYDIDVIGINEGAIASIRTPEGDWLPQQPYPVNSDKVSIGSPFLVNDIPPNLSSTDLYTDNSKWFNIMRRPDQYDIIKVCDFLTDEIDFKLIDSIDFEFTLWLAKSATVQNFNIRIYQLCIIAENDLKVSTTPLFTHIKGNHFSSLKVTSGAYGGRFTEETPIQNPSTIIEYILRDYDNIDTYPNIQGVTINTTSFDNISTARKGWYLGRQLSEKKFTYEYINELLAQSFCGLVLNGNAELELIDISVAPKNEFTINETNIIKSSINRIEKLPASDVYLDCTLNYGYNYSTKKFDKKVGIINIEQASFPLPYAGDVTHSVPLLDEVNGNFLTGGEAKIFESSDDSVTYTYVMLNLDTDPTSQLSIYDVVGSSLALTDTTDGAFDSIDWEYVTVKSIPNSGGLYNFLTYRKKGYINQLFGVSSTTVLTTVTAMLYKNPYWVKWAVGYLDYDIAKNDWDRLHNEYLKIGVINKLPSAISDCKWMVDIEPMTADYNPTPYALYKKFVDWVGIRKEKTSFEIILTSDTLDYRVGSYVKLRHILLTDNEYRHGIIQGRKINPEKLTITLDVLFYDVQRFDYIDGGLNTEVTDSYNGGFNTEVTDSIDGGKQ